MSAADIRSRLRTDIRQRGAYGSCKDEDKLRAMCDQYVKMRKRDWREGADRESLLTKVREPLIRKGWRLIQDQERGKPEKGLQEVGNGLADEEIWR